MFAGGKRKGKFPVAGAIEVGQPGAGTELDADLSLSGKKPSGNLDNFAIAAYH